MPHFFIKKENILNENIILNSNDENFFHIVKVLRAKKDENIKFIDEDKYVYYCKINEINKNTLEAEILNKELSIRTLKNNICLIQSILLGDSQNEAVSNATQSGVKEIYPVISDNVSSKKNQNAKVQKWQKVMQENFKQCERADFALIHEVSNLKDVLKSFKRENILIFAEKYENKTLNNCLDDIDLKEKIAIVIGPEGGFSKSEFDYFIENNFKLITLGKMIYKAPNAITAGVSNIISRLED